MDADCIDAAHSSVRGDVRDGITSAERDAKFIPI